MSSGVGDSEVIPLGVVACSDIWVQNEIVGVFLSLNNASQICAFKSRLKNQSVVVFLILQAVERLNGRLRVKCHWEWSLGRHYFLILTRNRPLGWISNCFSNISRRDSSVL